jgi:hypothetical protein
MVLALIMNLIPDPQRPEEEKLATGQMPSQYLLMIGHMAKANKEIHHRITRTILLMDATKTRPLPAIRLICRHQSIRHSRSLREKLTYAATMASGDGVMMLATETSRHNGKPVEMADPSKANNLAMTTVCTTAVTRISIALHAATMTKGKAPTAITMIQLHEEQREAIAVAEIRCTTSSEKGVTLNHPHQAALMVVVAAVAA